MNALGNGAYPRSTVTMDGVFVWRPSNDLDFEADILEGRKEECQNIMQMFLMAKQKRAQEEAYSNDGPQSNHNNWIESNGIKRRRLTQDANMDQNKAPFMDTVFDTPVRQVSTEPLSRFYEPKYSFFDVELPDGEETDDEEIKDSSATLSTQGHTFWVPKNAGLIRADVYSDGFDVVPQALELLSDSDPYKLLPRPKFLRTAPVDIRKLKKREKVPFPVAPLYHPHDRATVPDKELSEAELELRRQERTKTWKQAWTYIVKTDIPIGHKKMQQSSITAKKHLHKCALITAKEMRKKAGRSMRGLRDVGLRARRLTREMQSHWRRHDRDVEESRRKRMKDAADARKRAEDIREERRQQRKLEFLLSQTELFSHFIGAKMGLNQPQMPHPTNLPGMPGQPNAMSGAPGEEDDMGLALTREEAAAAAQQYINDLRRTTAEFDRDYAAATGRDVPDDGMGGIDKIDLLHPSTMPEQQQLAEASIFNGKLKSYQVKGLNWLVNLYEQGINGILADEMGLGKTIQSISFMAHLAEVKGLWGPYLVVAPNSVVHNWCREINVFCPCLKVLPYWGSQKDREIMRKFWKPSKLCMKDGDFHVLVTSYSTFTTDEKYFQKMRWHFMILDEAQAIKNSSSQRWKALLQLRCRNRLLLTGTPIQNSMAELWSLLHFIMPQLFDNHEEFNEWFSKDIEGHAEGKAGAQLNTIQLKRLHLILKPFMLRRIKRDVENEMPAKIETLLKCYLAPRQRRLYQAVRNQILFNDLLENNSKESLMNLVMQFRKVCNHPEIFKRRATTSPYIFRVETPSKPLLREKTGEIWVSNRNPISFKYPRLLENAFRVPDWDNLNGCKTKTLINTLSIFAPQYIHSTMKPIHNQKRNTLEVQSCFSFIRFFDMSIAELGFVANATVIHRWLFHLFRLHRLYQLNFYSESFSLLNETDFVSDFHNVFPNSYVFSQDVPPVSLPLPQNARTLGHIYPGAPLLNRAMLCLSSVPTRLKNADVYGLPKLVKCTPQERFADYAELREHVIVFSPSVLAPPVEKCTSERRSFLLQSEQRHNPWEKSFLLGYNTNSTSCCHGLRTSTPQSSYICPASLGLVKSNEPDNELLYPGLLHWTLSNFGSSSSQIWVPDFGKLLADSGKMMILDKLMKELKIEGRRVLIFSQMTKMINILEDYMHFRKYTYFRLDGSTQISDRTMMVEEFQRNPDIFAFLLSTRAGGLGINLTSADTVIFYDNDWNPTMDAQAMDRVHRIGQKKQVMVYRMVCQNTVEERILERAQQKFAIQKTVYSGGFKLQEQPASTKEDTELFKSNELKSFLLDE